LPVHLQPAYAELGQGRGSFPVAEQLADEVLSLPMYPELTPPLIGEVVEAVDRAVGARPAATIAAES
jgi:dTDP-4-amino-4,6-dideoxygalactose transaminase